MKKNKSGFILHFWIIIVWIFSLLALPVLNLAVSNKKIAIFLSKKEKEERHISEVSYYFKKAEENNTNWDNLDILSCPDITSPSFTAWIWTFWESSFSCSTSQNSSSDSIQDDWDNNDYKCSYFDFSLASKVSPSSKKCDDDDLHRKEFRGIIFPGETKTVFYSSEESNLQILNNQNNIDPDFTFPKRIFEVNNGNIKLDVSHLNFSWELYTVDKKFWENNIFMTEKNTKLLPSGSVLNDIRITDSDQINNSWTARDFDFSEKNYILNLTNSWNDLLYFTSYVEESGEKAYIVPIRDDLTEKSLLFWQFRERDWNLIFKWNFYEE